MKRWKTYATLLFVVALLGFSIYALLDTLLISRVYTVVGGRNESPAETISIQPDQTDSTPVQTTPLQAYAPSRQHGGSRSEHKRRSGSGSTGSSSKSESTEQTENTASALSGAYSYSGEGVSVQLSSSRYLDTTVYVADILLEDPSGLQTAFARSSYGRNVTAATSATAGSVGAVLAINGDNYGARETGYVIRDGILYRGTAAKNQEDLVIYSDGSFAIVSEQDVTAQELLDSGAVQVFSFGPGLLEEGKITVSESDEVGRAKASNPRTAIGILGPKHYVLVVSDGRSSESEGLSLHELAQFLQSFGVQTAYNLDGGGSSTMVFNGAVVNQPSNGRERAVTDIIYIS